MGENKNVLITDKNILKTQYLMEIFAEKMATPDPPHGFTANWTYATSEWIRTLDTMDKQCIFEYIGYILNQSGDIPFKTKTIMMLLKLSCPETKKLLDKLVLEGAVKHTAMDIGYADSFRNKM